MVVTDIIPAGMVYLPESLDVSGAATSPQETVSAPNDGTEDVTVTWNFGTVDNSENKDLKIQFQSSIANVESNQDGVTLPPNKASLSWTDSQKTTHDSSGETDFLKIVEPDLEIERSFEPSGGWRGDEVACTLSLRHTLAALPMPSTWTSEKAFLRV